MKTLLLYTTSGCHLCELAKDMISGHLDGLELQLEEVEIADSGQLMDRYGIRIPVLRIEGAEQELGWPFSEQHFLEFARQD
ncbi:MAG: glutaredoxin family protein [Pseudohongiellaceae bacterium]